LETLVAALFSTIDGFVEVDRNINTQDEEIDIVYRNESNHPTWQKESTLILVECKNWTGNRVGKNEFVLFQEKIENRSGRCRLGFLVCVEDFADTVTKEMLRSSKNDLLIVPIDGAKLRQLSESEDRNQLLLDFFTLATLV
jgi:predicted helicase